MISNYNLDCGYHNFELKDKIYLVPDWALKVIYTDGYNEVVYQGDSSNVTLLEGHEITFQEETSFDERFKFSKTLSIKVNGYKTFNDLDYRYYAIIETKDSEFYLVNVDFPSFVTHTYTLNASTNETELVFSSQSNIATLKLTNFEPNNVNSCNEYSTPKVKKFKLTESWASSLSTWQKSLVNKGSFSDIEPLQDSISLTEEFDGEKYTVTLGFDIPMSHFKNDWHIKLLQFEENKYRGYISLEDGNKAFVGYNVGLFPSYTINGDIISIRLTETAIRGIAYGDDYAIIDTNMPNSIEFLGATCKNYNFESSCDWEVEDKPDYITITPTSGQADTQYELTICNTDDETGYAVSEFVISTCNAAIKPEVVIKNPIYRYTATTETVCSEITNERWVESGTTCTGTHGVDKWVNSVKLVSYDDGETWFNTGIESATSLIETNSPDCGYAERWAESGTTCVGYDKHIISYKQISYDSGSTWVTPQPVQTAETIEEKSIDCGYSGYDKTYFTTVAIEDNTRFYFNSSGYTRDLYYSIDGGNNWAGGVPSFSVSAGTKVFWKCVYDSARWQQPFGRFYTNKPDNYMYAKKFDVEGNIMSLLYGDDFVNKDSLAGTVNAFDSLFNYGNYYSSVVNAENLVLPATTLAKNCYASMFFMNRFLKTAPVLSATSLADGCYALMFYGCSSLTTAPALPTTTLTDSCYSYMFYACSSLTTAPALPATTLARYCYEYMFYGCSSLTTAPVLSATTLASECYHSMFRSCTSLTTAPELPATTLAGECYAYMFANCTSLTTAPALLATATMSNCYSNMFSGCTNLKSIICLAVNSSVYPYNKEQDTSNWVKGVASSGTFFKNSNTTWSTGVNGKPSGWTTRNYSS